MALHKTKSDKLSGAILIVEDNLFMAELLSEKISDMGYEALSVYDGKEALKKIEDQKLSLVLLDLPLNGDPDGFKVLEGIRKKYSKKELPVLVLFNMNDPKNMKESLRLGANAYIVKALTSTGDITEKIRNVLENKNIEPALNDIKIEAPVQNADLNIKVPVPEKKTGKIHVPEELKQKIGKMLKGSVAEVSIIGLVDDLLKYSFLVRASDIHLEPFDDKLVARLRIDGILYDMFDIPKDLHSGVVTRIKVLGGMRTDEHQAALDGRFRMSIKDPERQFDVRVSIIPTYYGENSVLRLLAEQTQISKVDDLAFTETDKIKIRRALKRPHGMILATGPTGSGKTTTLYTILKEITTREVSVITIEDPIEYSLEGIDQIQVNTRTGLTFANGLRSILRQDPNIIMVGEIRDEETASIAVNAALTGHKLLSTLHTNDAATTLPRLLEMGVEPFLVASTINIALGQRLVRVLCQKCKIKKKLTEGEFQNLKKLIPLEILGDNREFYYPKGCDYCAQSGYYDRIGIYEVLEVNDFVREAIMRRADAGEVKKIAIKNGMVTLLEDGFKKALAGYTTIEEILRVVRE